MKPRRLKINTIKIEIWISLIEIRVRDMNNIRSELVSSFFKYYSYWFYPFLFMIYELYKAICISLDIYKTSLVRKNVLRKKDLVSIKFF